MKYAIVSCTQKSDYKQTLLYKSLARLEKDSNFCFLDHLTFFVNNKLGLSQAYNNFWKRDACNVLNDFVVFVHDDIWIDDATFIQKLERAHKNFDIIGIAGGINPVIKAPALWHMMCGGFQGGNLRGFAGHILTEGEKVSITNFGQTPERVTIIDGAFMSVNLRRAEQANWQFNENYTYHHYDISSCLDANKKKLKIGVIPILSYHASPGLKDINDKTFNDNQAKFLMEYASY